MFGTYTKFTTIPGKRQELRDILLQAAKTMETVEGCHQYIVNESATEEDVIWVTEIWDSKETHDASLTMESSKQLISQAMPLMGGAPEQIVLHPIGGKGI